MIILNNLIVFKSSMSLPPALLARLKRRKIIVTEPEVPTTSSSGQNYLYEDTTKDDPSTVAANQHAEQGEEEIVAADYDSDDDKDLDSESDEDNYQSDLSDSQSDLSRGHYADVDTKDRQSLNEEQEEGSSQTELRHEPEVIETVLGCPNKSNIYHDCSQYCKNTYSNIEQPEPTLLQRKHLALILRTLPIMEDWSIVYDPGVRAFYFWHINTNQVSWFPPGLGAQPGPSADQIRRIMKLNLAYQKEQTQEHIE